MAIENQAKIFNNCLINYLHFGKNINENCLAFVPVLTFSIALRLRIFYKYGVYPEQSQTKVVCYPLKVNSMYFDFLYWTWALL